MLKQPSLIPNKIILFSLLYASFFLFNSCKSKENVEPTKISFKGTYDNKKIKFEEGKNGAQIYFKYEKNCSTYVVYMEDNDNSFRFYLSGTDSYIEVPYDEIVREFFVVDYSKVGIPNPGCYSTKGMVFKSQWLQSIEDIKESKIKVKRVFKSVNTNCVCNSDLYWVVYEITYKGGNGELTLRFDNPCCLKD